MFINEMHQSTSLTLSQSRLVALSIGLMIFLSISTSLRFKGLPIGPGELVLFLFIVGSAFFKPWHQVKNPLFLFWVAVWICTAFGLLFGHVVGSLRMHNTLAYIFTGLITLSFLAVFKRLQLSDLQRIVFYFILITLGALWIGFVAYATASLEIVNALRIEIGYGRYQGWCQNANQMSLLLVPMPFLVMYLWDTASNKSVLQSIGWGMLLLSAVAMGLIVRSDALGFALIFGLIVLGMIRLRANACVNWRPYCLIVIIFAIAFIGVRVAAQQGWVGGVVSESGLYAKESIVEKLRLGHGETDEKVGIRLQLWTNALQIWKQSPIFGHGPGAYSNFQMGSATHFDGMEAHNTLIDLMVQGGALLGLIYVALFFWVVQVLWKSGRVYLLISALVLFAFEFFMFHLRQPVLWFYLSLLIALASGNGMSCDVVKKSRKASHG